MCFRWTTRPTSTCVWISGLMPSSRTVRPSSATMCLAGTNVQGVVGRDLTSDMSWTGTRVRVGGDFTTAGNTEVRMPAQTLSVPWAMSSAVQVRRTLVSELRANAIRHAQPLPDGMIRVNWAVNDGVVEVSVTDGGGPTTPAPAPTSPWSANGRGLRIVRSLAHEWGVKDDVGSCTVWVSLGGPSLRSVP